MMPGNLWLPSGFHRPMKLPLLLTLCAAALLSTPVFAEESDPLRGKIKELEERARTAKEQGRADESKELMLQVRRLHAEMSEREKQHGADNQPEMIRRKIEELHQAGKREEAEQLERRLQAGTEPERKQHALEAIKHLHAAGMHEPAERIEQMLRDHDLEQMGRAMHEMQEQTQRAFRETHEQMAKMARTIEELRAQLARQRGEGGPRKE